ncbi:Cys-Gln thioester bond-forming surface protein [Streptomyces sp. NPDC048288]|uniref:Cys-Gln thioester bond-forming surface protein n=1 Tax=Streptomyces sp. NPDC048288 TaxID=3365529 RepID=UPI00371F623B
MARLAAATLVSGLVAAVVLTGAGRATADDGTPQDQSGATATINGLKTYGEAVVHGDSGDEQVAAGLFEMSVDGGGTLQTYCVDLHNPTQRDARYHETAWSGTSLGANKSAGKIRWILQNSYPQVNDLAALARKAGVGSLTEQDAAAGTQVAIWRYSDGADVDAVDPQAEKLADYLEKSARGQNEPQASLTLTPPAVSGRPGGLLGPVTVHTNARTVTVIPPSDAALSGVRITDKTGKPVSTAEDGSQLYFKVPDDAAGGTSHASSSGGGSAELTVQASTTVPVGRAFTSESRSQTQILAGSSESTVAATANATWAEQGAVPALSAQTDCARSAVDLTAANTGDKPFTFELMSTEYTIPARTSRTVTIPLQEDQAYDFTITGPNGFERRFTGVLDCKTQGSDAGLTTQTLAEPSPASVGGTTGGTVNLAATGGDSATGVITGVAIGLVVIGGAVLVILRQRENQQTD